MTVQIHYILEKKTETVETCDNCTVSALREMLGSSLFIMINGLVHPDDYVISETDIVSAMPILEGG